MKVLVYYTDKHMSEFHVEVFITAETLLILHLRDLCQPVLTLDRSLRSN